ncbi:alpha/beta fold hydrolase [Streptomyces stramineus]
MTTFVLVPGPYAGSWVWDEVTTHLRASGAEVHTTTLTGFGDRRHLAGPGVDLDAHIEDLVQVLDQLAAPDVVLVGHCYSIHPVLGAADRRPERIARLVFIDGAMPQDGHSALDGLPDHLREGLQQRIDAAEDGWRLTPPPLAEWQNWGSVDGIPADAMERLARLAAPQSVATLTQPIRLTGAAEGLP